MRWLCLLALTVLTAQAEDLLPDQNRSIPRDALYGEALFHLHAGDYEKALALNHALKKRNKTRYGKILDIHEATAQLGLGMSRKAERKFQRYISTEKTSFIPTRARAQSWFYLAKHFYSKGLWKSALRSMKHVDVEVLHQDLTDEYHFLMATLELFAGAPNNADKHVLAISPESEWLTYAFLNVAVSYTERDIHINKVEAAFNKAISLVGNTRTPDELADRINLMAGKFFYSTGRGRSAIRHLKSISLESPYTPSALLTYGWALTEQWQYHDALQPWYMLKTAHPPLNQDVQETFIAIPHLLEKLNAKVLALGAFEFAVEQYEQIHDRLDESAKRLNTGKFIEPILLQQTPDKWGSYEPINLTLPEHPDQIYLKDVMSQGHFRGELQTLRDLHVMREKLKRSVAEIDAFQDSVETRKSEYQNIKQTNVLAHQANKLSTYQERYRSLLRKIDQAFNNPDGSGLASDDEKTLLSLFKSANQRIDKLSKHNATKPHVTNYEQRLRRVKGVLSWELAERYQQRKKQVSENLVILENKIKDTRKQLAASKMAFKEAPSAFTGFTDKLTKLRQKHLKQIAKLETTYAKQREKVGTIVKQDIHKRQQKINGYAMQARLAAARLFDETSIGNGRVVANSTRSSTQSGAQTAEAKP